MSKVGKVAAAGILVLAAACTGGATGEQSAERKAQTDECPPMTEAVTEKGTFTWMYSVDNTSFDPDKITTTNSYMYLYPIYDSLVHIDEEGSPQPMLAESWKVLDGGNVLEMDLINDWKYHDGTTFDAESVVANIERSKSLPGSFNANALENVNSVEAVDSDTVRFETDKAAGALVGVLGGASGMMMSPAAFDAPKQDIAPTGGSGAFEMTQYVPGSRVVYTAVDDYWAPQTQHVKKMIFTISDDDNARLNAVTTGAADSTFLRASMYEPAKEAGLVVCEQPSLASYLINLNTQRSEFGDKRVRQALNYAIDRKAIATVMDGFCEPGAQMFPTSYFASSPDLGPERFPYDPARAKKLLAAAGLENGFSFDLEVINLEIYQQVAEVVQANLAQAGIKMSITPADIDKLSEDFSVKKNVDAILWEQKGESDPSILTSSYYLADGFNNPGGYTTEEITRLNNKAMSGASPEARSPVYEKLFNAVSEEAAPNITLCHLTTPFAMNRQVKGLEIYADGARQFRGVGMAPQN
jgi:peptide/nickel transport system substrate-binding protein